MYSIPAKEMIYKNCRSPQNFIFFINLYKCLKYKTFSSRSLISFIFASSSPREGAFVHGLYLEGASWDSDNSILIDSRLKDLHPQMPVVYIKVMKILDFINFYRVDRGYFCYLEILQTEKKLQNCSESTPLLSFNHSLELLYFPSGC